MKRSNVVTAIIISLLTILMACQKEEEAITIEQRLDTYMSHWQEQAFEQMYQMLATESVDTYEPEAFVDRYQKIYEDLQIENISIDREPLDEEAIETAYEEKVSKIPFSLSMDTMAGEITFDYTATLVLEGEDEESEDWFLKWDPGYIFPPLKDGGEVSIQTEKPERGEIIDRNKMPLAMNDIVYEVGIVPENLEEAGEQEKEEVARLLDTTVEAIDDALNANWVEPHLYVPLGKVPQTKSDTVQALNDLQSTQLREVSGRIYPGEEATAHIIGYVGQVTAEELESLDDKHYSSTDIIGKTGLEKVFEDRLRGESGISIYIEKEDGETVMLTEKEAIDGEDIQLTIDINTQSELFKAYGDKAGTAAAINPQTGETLALVNSPAFDPNDFLYGNIQRVTQTLEEDDSLPLINRFTATYAPGSVLKPITAAIGLKTEVIDPEEGLEIDGLTWQKDDSWGDFSIKRVSSTDKPVDLADALIRSDNIYFAMQAIEMGVDQFTEGLKQFGFETEFPFDYPFKQSTISASEKINHEYLLANTSYGQGEIEISPLHLAITYTPFLNDGHMLKPTLLAEDELNQVWVENIISSKDAEFIRDTLSDIVTKGTGTAAKRDQLAISGKTGTAELKLSADDDSGKENGWFVGYPTEDKDILIAMLIEEVEDDGGSSYVADKVADVLVNLKK